MAPGRIRIARSSATAGANLGAVSELTLPMIEGQLITPVWFTATLEFQTGSNDIAFGLSHNRDIVNPASLHDLYTEPTMWLAHSPVPNIVWQRDLREFGIELAGPQSFVYFNGEANERTSSCMLYYTTRRVPDIQWASVANRTSFED